jgi:hypothetical protein
VTIFGSLTMPPTLPSLGAWLYRCGVLPPNRFISYNASSRDPNQLADSRPFFMFFAVAICFAQIYSPPRGRWLSGPRHCVGVSYRKGVEMRQILTTLTLAGLFSFVVLSNVSNAGCASHGNACAPKRQPCQPSERCKRAFARWDACREKFDINKCISNACSKPATIYTSAPCAGPVIPTPQGAPSGQGN